MAESKDNNSSRKTYSIAEAGRLLGIGRNAIYNAAARGKSHVSASAAGFWFRSLRSIACWKPVIKGAP